MMNENMRLTSISRIRQFRPFRYIQVHLLLAALFTLTLFHCGPRYEPEIIPRRERTESKEPESKAPPKVVEQKQKQKSKPLPKAKTKVPKNISAFQKGVASWYGGKFHGRRTANGEIYDKYKLTAAHKQLPFNTFVEVHNLDNDKRVIVRINDRGPFVKNRIIDLSKKAASRIDMEQSGTAPVALYILKNKNRISKREKIVYETENPAIEADWFYVQAGAFKEWDNAVRILNKIKRASDVAFSIKNSDGYYKVISVKLSPRKFAEKISSNLRKYRIETFVKSY